MKKPKKPIRTPRRQCAACPWRKDVDPRDIPNGYCEVRHANLSNTIAVPGLLRLSGPLRLMACHESMPGKEVVCAGWMANQLGPGNNLPLRMAVIAGEITDNFELAGGEENQHRRLEDTLPKPPRPNLPISALVKVESDTMPKVLDPKASKTVVAALKKASSALDKALNALGSHPDASAVEKIQGKLLLLAGKHEK